MRNSNAIQFLPALTGIRALCVYLIFLKHFNPFESNTVAGGVTNQFFSFLSFFFVLSGFLIAYRYLSTGSLNRKTLTDYFVNRISRVFPILIILITVTFLLYYFIDGQSFQSIIKPYIYNITLLKGFSSTYYLTGIGPSWSMSVEELFYIIAPLVFFTVRSVKGLAAFVLLMYLIAAVLVLLFGNNSEGFFSNYHFTFSTTFFGRAFEFACGIYLAYVLHGRIHDKFLSKIHAPTIIGGLLIGLILFAQYQIANAHNIVNGLDTFPGLIVNNIALPIGILIFFYGLVYKESAIKKMLSTNVMVELGNSTYSFYLIHTSFVAGLIQKYISTNVMIVFICMVVFSFLFYKTVEQPLAKAIRDLRKK